MKGGSDRCELDISEWGQKSSSLQRGPPGVSTGIQIQIYTDAKCLTCQHTRIHIWCKGLQLDKLLQDSTMSPAMSPG